MAQVFPYTVAAADFANGGVDWGTSNFYVILLQNAGGRSASHATVAAVIAATAEISVSGYARTAVSGLVAPTAANPSVCDSADVAFDENLVMGIRDRHGVVIIIETDQGQGVRPGGLLSTGIKGPGRQSQEGRLILLEPLRLGPHFPPKTSLQVLPAHLRQPAIELV